MTERRRHRLNDTELAALHAFEQRAANAEPVLGELGLAIPSAVADATLRQAKEADSGSFLSRHRIRNPRSLTESRSKSGHPSGESHVM